MAIRTIQIFNPAVPLDLSPGFDRLTAQHIPTREILTSLVERGELPRYRGDETQISVTDTEITVVMQWKSLSAAQEYMDAVLAFVNVDDPDRENMRSIEIIED